MAQIIEEIKSSVKDRLKSAFFGSFIIAWLIWNWRIIYLTFIVSEKQLLNQTLIARSKLEYITWYLLDTYHLFWYPLMSALGYIILGTFLNQIAIRIQNEIFILFQPDDITGTTSTVRSVQRLASEISKDQDSKIQFYNLIAEIQVGSFQAIQKSGTFNELLRKLQSHGCIKKLQSDKFELLPNGLLLCRYVDNMII